MQSIFHSHYYIILLYYYYKKFDRKYFPIRLFLYGNTCKLLTEALYKHLVLARFNVRCFQI